MAIETIGKYQVHLIGREVSTAGQYAPYVIIEKFDDEARDFKLLLDRQRVPGSRLYPTENAAEEAAREYANKLILAGTL